MEGKNYKIMNFMSLKVCGKHGHSFITIIFHFYVQEPCVILWENTNTQYYYAVTVQCYVGSSHSTCKMIIIVSVLNDMKWPCIACFTQIHTSTSTKKQT